MNWLATIAALDPADLRAISRMVDLLTASERARRDEAMRMLIAPPEPVSPEDARERVEAVTRMLEQ